MEGNKKTLLLVENEEVLHFLADLMVAGSA